MAHLSSDDFGRIQTQLLELKEKNYGLEDLLRRHKKELGETRGRLKNLEEENRRYQLLIKTSKKVTEVELMMRDNEYLRNKLKDQEEDFRLQNNTLLQEYTRIVGENERYERRVEVLCGDRGGNLAAAVGEHCSTDDSKEVVRLRGELTVMENKLYETEKQAEKGTQALKEKISALTLQVTQLTNVLKTHSIPVDEGEINLAKGGGVSFKKLSLHDDDGLEEADLGRPSGDPLDQFEQRANQLQKEVEDINCRLEVEQERANTLASQNTTLQEELRQASHRGEIELLQSSLKETKERLEETESKLSKKLGECESRQQSLQQLTASLSLSQDNLNSAKNTIEQKEKENQDVREEICQLQEVKTTAEEQNYASFQELSALKSTLESVKSHMDEQTNLAEMRYSLMEEMKQHLKEKEEGHKKEMERLCVSHGEELVSVTTHNTQLKEQLEKIGKKLTEATVLQEKVEEVSGERDKLEGEVRRVREEIEAARREAKEEADRQAAINIEKTEELKEKREEECKDHQTQLEISNIQRQEAEEAVEALHRKVADGEEEQRIYERKGLTLMKDLKKQLASERKRADRLQEKLSQLLTDPAQLTALTTAMSEGGDDVSSVSSWSLVSGELRESSTRDSSTRDNSFVASPQDSPPHTGVSEETASLVNRVTELQQQKWKLEEAVTHLEASSASLAEDLLKKKAIIHHYCMEHKTDGGVSVSGSPQHSAGGGAAQGVRRVVDMLRGGAGVGEESLREINRRLQALLEETLTKNMQLHTDVDNLSHQAQGATTLPEKNLFNK